MTTITPLYYAEERSDLPHQASQPESKVVHEEDKEGRSMAMQNVN